MIVYKIGGFKKAIEEVEAVRTTERTIFFGTHRQARFSNYYSYFDTLQEAKDFLIKKNKRIIENSEKAIINAKKQIEEIEKL